MKVIVLGGAGDHGLFTTRGLIDGGVFDEIVVASRNLENTQRVVDSLGSDKVSAETVDVMNHDELVDLLKDADVVANCTGPYYLLGEYVINAAIDAGTHYVDFCDDVVVQEKMFNEDNQRRAEEQGIAVIMGFGLSPGLLPMHVMHYASKLDEVHDVSLPMIGSAGFVGEGTDVALLHIIENFVDGIGVIKDGKHMREKGFEHTEMYDFGEGVGEVLVATLGHPETFSLPKVLPNLQNVRIQLGFYETEWFEKLRQLIEDGFASLEPMEVGGNEVIPREYLSKHLTTNADPDAEFNEETILDVNVSGIKDDKKVKYKARYKIYVEAATGLPLSMGAERVAKGEVDKTGMLVPEECFEPTGFVEELIQRMQDGGHQIDLVETVETEEHIVVDK